MVITWKFKERRDFSESNIAKFENALRKMRKSYVIRFVFQTSNKSLKLL